EAAPPAEPRARKRAALVARLQARERLPGVPGGRRLAGTRPRVGILGERGVDPGPALLAEPDAGEDEQLVASRRAGEVLEALDGLRIGEERVELVRRQAPASGRNEVDGVCGTALEHDAFDATGDEALLGERSRDTLFFGRTDEKVKVPADRRQRAEDEHAPARGAIDDRRNLGLKAHAQDAD